MIANSRLLNVLSLLGLILMLLELRCHAKLRTTNALLEFGGDSTRTWKQANRNKREIEPEQLDNLDGIVVQQMELMHDVIWTTKIKLGNQEFSVVIDTGSSDLWLPSIECTSPECLKRQRYDPSKSGTFLRDAKDNRTIQILYGGNVQVYGRVARDSLELGGVRIESQAFVLVHQITGPGIKQLQVDGILGLGFMALSRMGAMTPFEQMLDQKLVRQPVFSIAPLSSGGAGAGSAGRTSNKGKLTFGSRGQGYQASEFVNASLIQARYWQFALESVSLEREELNSVHSSVLYEVCSGHVRCKAIADSGAALIIGSSKEVREINSQLGAIELPVGIFIFPSCQAIKLLPNLVFTLTGGEKLVLTPEMYIVKRGGQCLSGLALQPAGGFPFWILGTTFLNNFNTLYDYQNERRAPDITLRHKDFDNDEIKQNNMRARNMVRATFRITHNYICDSLTTLDILTTMTTECHCPKDLVPLLMVEYPGFVKNVDKALATLGGIDAIDRVSRSEKDRLELKFRRLDSLAHPAYGDRSTKKCLVLRLTKTKKANSDEIELKVSVVGKVQTAYCFETLAEFQWLPMQRTNASDKLKAKDLDEGIHLTRTPESLNPQYASILDDILPIKDPFDNELKQFNPDAPLLILPAIFSRFDTPRDVHQYKLKFRSKEMRDEFDRQQRQSIIGRTRKKRSTMTYLLSFGDPIPTEPPEKLIKEREAISSYQHSLVPRMRACFARQKVWSKAAICYELNCTLLDVKYTLPLVSYHWQNGPFRTMWCEYGYDPHKDKASKILQTLDFRIKNPLDQQEYSRRSMHQYQLPMRKNPEMRTKKQLDLKSVISNVYNPLDERLDDESPAFTNAKITESMCKFRQGSVPPARQLSYHLKDIELDEVQKIVHSNDAREPEVCSQRDGWLREKSIEEIRKIMVESLRQTIETMTDQLVHDTK